MNERIKQLAEQAGLKYYNWSTIESNIIDGDFKYPRLEDYKKFAELIVRECVDIANKNRTAMEMVISALAIIIFLGLTAYDTQKIREELSVETTDVAEVRGALTLYMDFINLFLNLLQLFGDRKE